MAGAATVLRGAPVARRIRAEAAASAEVLARLYGVQPTLVTLQVGDDPAASAYRDSIQRSVSIAGVRHQHLGLPMATSPNGLVTTIEGLNAEPTVHGVLLLVPMPPHLPLELVSEHLSPLKDVDGITPVNAGRLYLGLPALRPSTPQGGLELLDHYGIPLRGSNVTVIGRSSIVGRPLAWMLTMHDATVTLCHRRSRDLEDVVRAADIVAVGAGSPGLVTGDMLKSGATVVDFGVNVVGGRVVGDADAESVARRAGAYTPVPGGTGPVTAAVLARNTVAAAFATLHGSLDESEGLTGLNVGVQPA